MSKKDYKTTRLINRKSNNGVPFGPSVLIENLPLPVVHYPSYWGTFVAFSNSLESDQFLCECSIPAIENYLLIHDSLMNHDFTDSIYQLLSNSRSINNLKFKNRICHRCNLASPSAKFCHEMYGGNFQQYYGWYINQNAFKLGIGHNMYNGIVLDDRCPKEILELIIEKRDLEAQYLNLDLGFTKRPDFHKMHAKISDRERVIFQRNIEIQKLLSKNRKKISKIIENITRLDFGFRKIGDGWVAETMLFMIVSKILYGQNLIRHFRPDWLYGLELDIYIPSINLGIEYQGQQHFIPIKSWGGQRSLDALRERDLRKKELCKIQGIRLIEIDFTEPLTEKYIYEKIQCLEPQNCKNQQTYI